MEQMILSPISLSELTDIIQLSVRGAMQLQPEPQPAKQDHKIFGIKGLAAFVNCSEPTAVKIARSKKFNRYQDGRKIFFLESEVLKGLKR
jgi:hypothetical protein